MNRQILEKKMQKKTLFIMISAFALVFLSFGTASGGEVVGSKNTIALADSKPGLQVSLVEFLTAWSMLSSSCNSNGFCEANEDPICCEDCSGAIGCSTDGVCCFDEGSQCPDCNDQCGISGSGGGPGGGNSFACNNNGFCETNEHAICCADCSGAIGCSPDGICDFDEGSQCPDCNDQCGS